MKAEKSLIVPVLLLALGGLLIAFGVKTGGVDAVFLKAIKICMECIGIG